MALRRMKQRGRPRYRNSQTIDVHHPQGQDSTGETPSGFLGSLASGYISVDLQPAYGVAVLVFQCRPAARNLTCGPAKRAGNVFVDSNRHCNYGVLDLENRKEPDAAHAPRGARVLRHVCWVRGRTSQSHASGLGRSTVQFERKAAVAPRLHSQISDTAIPMMTLSL
jgi:hypothetical protein